MKSGKIVLSMIHEGDVMRRNLKGVFELVKPFEMKVLTYENKGRLFEQLALVAELVNSCVQIKSTVCVVWTEQEQTIFATEGTAEDVSGNLVLFIREHLHPGGVDAFITVQYANCPPVTYLLDDGLTPLLPIPQQKIIFWVLRNYSGKQYRFILSYDDHLWVGSCMTVETAFLNYLDPNNINTEVSM